MTDLYRFRICAGNGGYCGRHRDTPVYLKLDWSTIQKPTADDPAFGDDESSGGQDDNGNGDAENDGNESNNETAV